VYYKVLQKHRAAIDDEKTDGVTGTRETHQRGYITSTNEAVNNALSLFTYQISWKNKRELSVCC
jgi:hypothetical protein